MNLDYKAVIGLEIHLQLNTQSKAYCADQNVFGEPPNTKVSPISIAHPGTLPRVNKKNIEFAVKLASAIKAEVTYENQFARKNYFYADLPKGYQITQDKTPIGVKGKILINPHTPKEKEIAITRIHLEEDAGKSIHNQDPFNSLIDLNRAGVPLIEIVSEPDIETSQEAYDYVTEVRKLVRYLDICDGNMEEGSMRCDANVSVMLKHSKEFGQRTETKNINSIRNVKRAIDFEIERQIKLLEEGGTVKMETRSFDMVKGTTFSLRSKEAASDYRYFPEPDILPVFVTKEYISAVEKTMPQLPNQLYKKFTDTYGLSAYDSSILTESKSFASYYLDIVAHTTNYKMAANWINGPIRSLLNEKAIEITEFKIAAKKIAAIIALIDNQKISYTVASQKLFPCLLENPNKDVLELATSNKWIQENSDSLFKKLIDEVIVENAKEVERFKNGESKLQGFLMGQLMKKAKGRINPKKASNFVEKIKKNKQ